MPLSQRLGINVHLLNDPHGWDAAASLGITWARLDLNWDTVQPRPDQWDWEVVDQAVSGARQRGLQIFASLAYTPSWANAGAGRGAPATSIMDWTRFVREAGLRYRGHIRTWGIWNEYQGSVSAYIMYLLRPAREVLKQLDAENLVCGPEMATEGDWPTWLKSFLLAAGTDVDVITIHAYDDDGHAVWRKLTQARKWYEVWKKPSIREVIEKAGFLRTPCWLTETGFQSTIIGENKQGEYCDVLLERLNGNTWPSGILWFNFIDEPHHSWGIFRADGSEKPIAAVLRRYTERGTV